MPDGLTSAYHQLYVALTKCLFLSCQEIEPFKKHSHLLEYNSTHFGFETVFQPATLIFTFVSQTFKTIHNKVITSLLVIFFYSTDCTHFRMSAVVGWSLLVFHYFSTKVHDI